MNRKTALPASPSNVSAMAAGNTHAYQRRFFDRVRVFMEFILRRDGRSALTCIKCCRWTSPKLTVSRYPLTGETIMKILVPADGSEYTKKALAFLVVHPELLGNEGEIFVLHVQPAMPPRVTAMVGSAAVHDYHLDEAGQVLAPIEEFLKRHGLAFRTKWVVGYPASEIVEAAVQEKAHLIVMGTHGHGLLGRALMGSVAQNVLAESDIPVLLVK
jgi:nucleotide-binding universal stress UspA family protein